MDYVQNFIRLITDQSPHHVEFDISNISIRLDKGVVGKAKDAFLRYEGKASGSKVIFDFHHAHLPDDPFNRIDLKIPGRSGQVTSFHLTNLGFVSGEKIIDITQTIKLSGRDKLKNKRGKELAVDLLGSEGLLYPDNENKWYVATYDNHEQSWLYGGSTESFITNFLKVGVIMGRVRGIL